MKSLKSISLILVSLVFASLMTSCEKLFNKPPKISNQHFLVEETCSVNTIIGTVVATDKSGQTLTFEIVFGNDDEVFAISSSTGVLTVNREGLFNFKIAASRRILVEITDEFGKASTAEMTINIINMPPVINDQLFSITETSPETTVVGTVIATDRPTQTMSFSIVSGNSDNAFAISQNDGILKVNKTGVLDFETSPSRVISISVADEFGKSSAANITINITDIQPTTEGLVLYLPFNENTNDLSVNSNNGIDYTAGNYVTGMRGKALDFNGSTDYIQLTSTLDASKGLTFSFWIKTRGVLEGENNGTIISKYTFVGALRSFHVYSLEPYSTLDDNRLIAYFHNDRFVTNANNDMCKSYLETQYLIDNGYNTTFYSFPDPKKLTVNEWTHCVVNLTSTDLEIWTNGVLRTKKAREYQSYFNSDDCPTYIGNCLGSGSGTNNHFNGLIDELRVYNRGLTPEEIQILFTE